MQTIYITIKELIHCKPLVTAEEIGFDNPIYTEERFLSKLLVSLGIFKSISQVRKNSPDLIKQLTDLDFIEIKIGKSHLWLLL